MLTIVRRLCGSHAYFRRKGALASTKLRFAERNGAAAVESGDLITTLFIIAAALASLLFYGCDSNIQCKLTRYSPLLLIDGCKNFFKYSALLLLLSLIRRTFTKYYPFG